MWGDVLMNIIKLMDGWQITQIGRDDQEIWVFHHQCNASHACLGRIQKTTHRRYGVRYRCNDCHAVAPKQVVAHYKLRQLGEKR